MVDRIKKEPNDLIEELKEICEIENVSFSYERKNDNLTQIQLLNDVTIRIYNTKKGLKIDDSIATNQEVANKIIDRWKELYYKKQDNKNYTYERIKNPEKIKRRLLELEQLGLDVKENESKANGCVFSISIIEKRTSEKITIHFYTSGKLLVQGFTGHLWEEVCRIIETEENYKVYDIVKRISNESLNCISNEKKDDFIEYEDDLKNILTEDAYNFLSNEDKEYLISAHVLIQNNIRFPRYNAILCPACLTLEGYLKKLLVKLNIVKQYQIGKSNFNFGMVFDEKHKLPDSIIKVIKSTDIEDKNNIKKVLERLYLKIRTFRNPACHSSGGMGTNINNVKSFSRCKELYMKEILESIKNSYHEVYK